MPKRLYRPIFGLIAVLVGLWLTLDIVSRLFAEIAWFQEVDYLSALIIRWISQCGLWLLICTISGMFLGGNLWIANRLQWRWLPKDDWFDVGLCYLPQQKELVTQQTPISLADQSRVKRYLAQKTYSPRLKLPLLLTVAIIAGAAIACILLHYSEVALSVWESSYKLPKISSTLRPPLDIFTVSNITGFILSYLRQLGVVVVIVLLLLLKPIVGLRAIAILISIIFSFIWAENWTLVLRFFNPSSFNYLEPQFNQDIGFYIFRLPLWQLVESWLLGIFSCALISCFLFYLLSGNSLSEGKFLGFSRVQLRHLSFLGAAVMTSLALQHWLNRYDLLYDSRGIIYGAGYTNIKVQLPIEIILTIVSLISAAWLLFKGFTGYRNLQIQQRKVTRIVLLALPFTIYLFVFSISNLLSETVQYLVVQPNELNKERTYIERSILMTRKAFNLDAIESKMFNPQGELTAQDIKNNYLTIKNIRLWDTRPILQTNRQLQQIRPYYQFLDADIDRYILKGQNYQGSKTSNNNKQQVIIAARELDYAQVFNIAKTWLNEHLVYTHGYGFTVSPVNQVSQGGLPEYFVKDIGTGTEESGTLTVSSEVIRQSIPIGKPRIYYGELTNSYIMTSTKVKELDFPSGEENVYNTYDGKSGIKIGNYLRRLLFAEYLKDWPMVFTQNFTPETKLLFRRNIKQRVQEIAPFLNYDIDPYLVAAKTSQEADKQGDHLYWIIDAYTTSDRYPYSDPGNNKFNYLRNSVKVVVDAYNGDVNFYISDSSDPMIQTWDKVFPQLFQPLSAMPGDLRRHIRYPEDLFNTQSERLLTYHMTDPQVFYNREDQWQIPQEIYGAKFQQVAPYYLIMKLPTAIAEEFILLHPYTPTSRPNLIAWLAARSDGEEYGKLLLYKFPKQKLIYGPNQVEALINQDPTISQQISLWNREGSRAIQGNLLIIPIEKSLLYVEPLYLEAKRNSVPILARVIVVYGNQIVMAETLEAGLDIIFNSQPDDLN